MFVIRKEKRWRILPPVPPPKKKKKIAHLGKDGGAWLYRENIEEQKRLELVEKCYIFSSLNSTWDTFRIPLRFLCT